VKEHPLPLLEACEVSKAYAGVQALSEVSFALQAREVHALVGENGAGKSTLIRIITGAEEPDRGEIRLGGAKIESNSPRAAHERGIFAIYQQPALFPELTVAENIAIGMEKPGRWGRIDWAGRRRRAAELLARVGAQINPGTLAGDLSMPEQQLVEIARALGAEARVLILDEPTASLSEQNAQNLFAVIRELRLQGVGVIYISHRLEELPQIADRVTVLRDGRAIETRSMSDVSRAQLIHLMVGREISSVYPKREVEPGAVVLELRDLGCSEAGIADVNLSVRAGEIVGLAGLVGAGRTDLARIIFGLLPADSGEIRLRGKAVKLDHPGQAIKNGIAYVPEDRRRHGVILQMQIDCNITLSVLDQFSGFGGLDFRRERASAADFATRLRIKTPALYSPVASLSGGNQQKVALSRWLLTKPAVLILDEPTQGIDIGAKSEIHVLMSELAGQGVAILMISSELPEILGISDRIAVMRGGRIVATLDRSAATQAEIMALALGRPAEQSSDPAPVPVVG